MKSLVPYELLNDRTEGGSETLCETSTPIHSSCPLLSLLLPLLFLPHTIDPFLSVSACRSLCSRVTVSASALHRIAHHFSHSSSSFPCNIPVDLGKVCQNLSRLRGNQPEQPYCFKKPSSPRLAAYDKTRKMPGSVSYSILGRLITHLTQTFVAVKRPLVHM